MPIDVEQQIANYFEWLDQSSGTVLHKSADNDELDDHDAEVVVIPHATQMKSRRWLMVVAAAAVVLAAVAVVAMRSRATDDGFATGQPPTADASWYVIDPASAFGSLGDGTEIDLDDRLACRKYDDATDSCTELVGQHAVTYRFDDDTTVTVTTDIGPEPSIMWQTLRIGAEAGEVAGHSGLINPTVSAVGFEAPTGTRVVVMASPPTSVETLTDIAASLTLVHENVVVPVVFGDSAPRGGEIPFDSVGARYYAGYVDLTLGCVGSFGVPWNGGGQNCVEVPDDKVTVIVASPSPAGTILIAALPSTTSSAAITLQDGTLLALPVAVAGFEPKLLFIDLDGAIPSHLAAHSSSGVIDETDITSTGGAALGYLSVDPDAVPRMYYSTEHPMTVWPLAASSGPYTSNAGYGMTPCDSGSWTKFAVLASATRWEHSYQGTLCAFTTLGHPIGDTAASCASMSTGTNYAQCKVLSESNDVTAPTGTDSGESGAEMQPAGSALLPTTRSDLPQKFGDQVSAVSLSEGDQYSDNSVSVTLSQDLDPGVTCFRISLADASSEGCLDRFLLTTGLAYGAFQRADGPIEVVGIVPDDVATVEIAGRVIPVTHNVWHYTGNNGDDLSFTVRSTDGSLTAAVR